MSGEDLRKPEDLYQYVAPLANSNDFYCTLCSVFKHSKKANVRNHIESKHFKGVFLYQCDICQDFKNSKQEMYVCKSNHKKNAARFVSC